MIFAANFKMNHTRASTAAYMAQLATETAALCSEDRVIVFPPATALDRYTGNFTVGAQNAYPASNGAYTGEIGLDQLAEFSIDTILIGHSERREILGESQERVAEKYRYFQSQNFEIIYCIGEPLEVRQQGHQAVMDYLLAQFEGIDTGYARLMVAYEPIWAIGTGRTATTEEIASTHAALKEAVAKPLLYGGSVKPANVKEIIQITDVDGVLVGGASLEVESFMALVRA